MKSKSATISLFKETELIYSSKTDSSILMLYQDLETGFYKLVVNGEENISELRDSIFVNKGQRISADIQLDILCPYIYPYTFTPICPNNHQDMIIPIIYKGDILQNSKIKKRTLFKNFIATGCLPRFYCTKHSIEF